MLDAHDGPGLALDLSPYAARRAARCHPRAGAVVADAWRALPVRDAVAGAVLSVFAPRGAAEAARVLAPGGRLVVVTPDPAPPGRAGRGRSACSPSTPTRRRRLDRQLKGFALRSEEPVEQALVLAADHVRDVVAMGPSAHHVDAAALPDLAGEVTLSVRVATYERA